MLKKDQKATTNFTNGQTTFLTISITKYRFMFYTHQRIKLSLERFIALRRKWHLQKQKFLRIWLDGPTLNWNVHIYHKQSCLQSIVMRWLSGVKWEASKEMLLQFFYSLNIKQNRVWIGILLFSSKIYPIIAGYNII